MPSPTTPPCGTSCKWETPTNKRQKLAAKWVKVSAACWSDWDEVGKQVSFDDYRRLQAAEFGRPLVEEWQRFESIYGRSELGRADRYYLLVSILGRPDAWNKWLYERCREVEAEPDGHIDLWAREHYKSTIITLAGIIQEIIRDPEITVGIFSHTKSVSRKFLAQIKLELESNSVLHALYPECLYADPRKESPRWSIDGGLIVKRKSNPKEATIEGHGLVDGMPTGAHFGLLVYPRWCRRPTGAGGSSGARARSRSTRRPRRPRSSGRTSRSR